MFDASLSKIELVETQHHCAYLCGGIWLLWFRAIACGLLHSIEERGIGKFAWIEKLEDVTGFTIL